MAAMATAYGLIVGIATGAGAMSIESGEAAVCTTPGDGGGGGARRAPDGRVAPG
jgi:hypothetical protein